MLSKLFSTKRVKLHRGEPIMKHGATKSTIKEDVRACRQCFGKNERCSLCKGAGFVVCELIVNIFPNDE